MYEAVTKYLERGNIYGTKKSTQIEKGQIKRGIHRESEECLLRMNTSSEIGYLKPKQYYLIIPLNIS